jgi:DNA polymerase I-like protein with 3'-5' exonuclease and polymerase domains
MKNQMTIFQALCNVSTQFSINFDLFFSNAHLSILAEKIKRDIKLELTEEQLKNAYIEDDVSVCMKSTRFNCIIFDLRKTLLIATMDDEVCNYISKIQQKKAEMKQLIETEKKNRTISSSENNDKTSSGNTKYEVNFDDRYKPRSTDAKANLVINLCLNKFISDAPFAISLYSYMNRKVNVTVDQLVKDGELVDGCVKLVIGKTITNDSLFYQKYYTICNPKLVRAFKELKLLEKSN